MGIYVAPTMYNTLLRDPVIQRGVRPLVPGGKRKHVNYWMRQDMVNMLWSLRVRLEIQSRLRILPPNQNALDLGQNRGEKPKSNLRKRLNFLKP